MRMSRTFELPVDRMSRRLDAMRAARQESEAKKSRYQKQASADAGGKDSETRVPLIAKIPTRFPTRFPIGFTTRFFTSIPIPTSTSRTPSRRRRRGRGDVWNR